MNMEAGYCQSLSLSAWSGCHGGTLYGGFNVELPQVTSIKMAADFYCILTLLGNISLTQKKNLDRGLFYASGEKILDFGHNFDEW